MNMPHDAHWQKDEFDLIRQEAMEFAGMGLYRFRFDGEMLFADWGALRVFELDDQFSDPTAVAGKKLSDLIVYTGPKGRMRQELRDQGRIRGWEWSFETLKGNEKWVTEDAYLVEDGDGAGECIQVVVRDITARRRAEEALRVSEERFRETQTRGMQVSEQLRALMVAMNACRTFEEMLDPLLDTAIEVCQMEIGGVYLVEEGEAVLRRHRGFPQGFVDEVACLSMSLPLVQRILAMEGPVDLTELAEGTPDFYQTYGLHHVYSAPLRAGDTVFGLLNLASTREAPPDAISMRSFGAMVLESESLFTRLRAEEALRESERKYREILENMQEGYYELDLEGSFTFFNDALCRIFGYSEDELRGLNYRRYYADDAAADHAYAVFDRIYETGGAAQLQDWRVLRKDGTEAVLEVSAALMAGPHGRAAGFRGIIRDVTERHQTGQALAEAEARYRELFENANDIIYTHDLEGHFTSLNKAGERISGYTREESHSITAEQIVTPEYRDLVRTMVARKLGGEKPTRYEVEMLAKDGTRIPVEVSTRLIYKDGKPFGIQGIARDMTEHKRAEAEHRQLEAQIQHAQKLEGLGVLAGGIAHDFNNLLVGVLGNAGLALTRLPDDSPAREYVKRIEATAKRAAELTNQMLAYSGKGAFVMRPINLSEHATEMSHLLGAAVLKHAELRFDCPEGLPQIGGDPAQLHQVLMNLITNASDAIGEEPGVITVRTRAVNVDRAYLAKAYLDDDLAEGRYLCIEVSDTGCGMDEETKARIFDPFFTTKFTGRGLGLAATLGIVRGHKGAILVYSELGQGTTFKVFFPALPQEMAEEAEDEPAQSGAPPQTWRGQGSVLLVDDEREVREVAQAMLEECGFQVLVAVNGLEAVELFQRHTQDVTVILLDLMMPVMDGRKACRKLLDIRSDVPIILSSGYTEQDAASRFSGQGPAGFIQKPYMFSELVKTLSAVLPS